MMTLIWLLALAPIVAWLVFEYRRNAQVAWVVVRTRRPHTLDLLREQYVHGVISHDEFVRRVRQLG